MASSQLFEVVFACEPSFVHPVGVVVVALPVVLNVQRTINKSPALTVAGIVTGWLVGEAVQLDEVTDCLVGKVIF